MDGWLKVAEVKSVQVDGRARTISPGGERVRVLVIAA